MAQATIEHCEQEVEPSNNQADIAIKSPKKTKTTIYLTEEAEHAFTELYIARYRKDRKVDRSTIDCEAILALFEKELPEEKNDKC